MGTHESRSRDLVVLDASGVGRVDVDNAVLNSVKLGSRNTGRLGVSTFGDLDLDARRVLKRRIRCCDST